MLKIAQIAPLYESVPPKLYGGTERIVHYLTEALISQGHKVTLFASGDSLSKGRLIANVEKGLRLNKDCVDPLAPHIVQMQEVLERVGEFDVLHFHTDYLHFPFSSQLAIPCITTLHGRLDLPELKSLYKKFSMQKLVSISDYQRKPLPEGNYVATVYHGLPRDLHQTGKGEGGYLAFLGRISPEKGVDNAIKIAIAAGVELKIAAKIDKVDQLYFERRIKPLFKHRLVEYVGEINEREKTEFLGNAMATLFPINWPEPFGLVMIESMACGTPVIAFRNGSVPEVIDEGKSGMIVRTVNEAVKAVSMIGQLPRMEVRRKFEERFTAARMAEDYTQLYASLIRTEKMKEVKHLKVKSLPNRNLLKKI